jgi:hypothetical protein
MHNVAYLPICAVVKIGRKPMEDIVARLEDEASLLGEKCCQLITCLRLNCFDECEV